MSHLRVSSSVSCLRLELQAQLAVVVFSLLARVASHCFSCSECRSLCILFKWYTRLVVLNVFVVFPPREADTPQELQKACLESSPTLKNSQIGNFFFDMAEEQVRVDTTGELASTSRKIQPTLLQQRSEGVNTGDSMNMNTGYCPALS